MNESAKRLIDGMTLNSPAIEENIICAGQILGIDFPDQYKEFMLETNGAEGNIGENSYLAIWPIECIAQYNADYEVNEFNPRLVYFGSDGGGMAFAFDNRNCETPIVAIPFESIDHENLELYGKTFNEFLQNLYARDE